MTAELKGKTEAAAHAMFDNVHKMLTGETNGDDASDRVGKLAILSGVCKFPARVKCASLAWHTLKAALDAAGARMPERSATTTTIRRPARAPSRPRGRVHSRKPGQSGGAGSASAAA